MASFQRDALTLSAEVLAVVGVADVVLRQLIALTDLATAAANASKSARAMRVRLQSLASAILSVRSWAESYAASDFVTDDGQRISASVTETLLQCSTRLGAIFKNIHDVEAGSSGALARFWTGLRFARDEKALQQSMSDLSAYTTALQLAMQSRQGTDLTILRRQQALHAKATSENHTATLNRFDQIQRHQAATQSAMHAGFQDLITTLQLTYLNEDEVYVEGDNLSAGVDALRYLNKHLSHSLMSLSESNKGCTLPRDVAATLTGEVDKMIRYSQRYDASGRKTLFPRADYTPSQHIHTIPIRIQSHEKDGSGFIAIEANEGEDALGRRTQHIRFTSFTVRPSGYGSAIVGSVSRINLGGSEQMRRQLRVLNILPMTSLVFDLASSDDVEGVKRLLTAGEASIFDYDEDGCGILWHAASSLSWNTIHLLLDLGADASECVIGADYLDNDIAWSIGLGVSMDVEISHRAGNTYFNQSEIQLRLCRDFLHLSKAKALEARISGNLVWWTCVKPPSTPEAKVFQKRYFDILWDSGMGRLSIMGMVQDPGSAKFAFLAAMTAWARGRAVRDDPAFIDTQGQTVLHLLLRALLYSWMEHVERLVVLMEASSTDWERVCRAAFFAQTFRESMYLRDKEFGTEKRLLLLLLKLGVCPLQQDNKGVSAWDVVQLQTTRAGHFRSTLLPFVKEEAFQA